MEDPRSPFRIEPKSDGVLSSRVARLLERILGLSALDAVLHSLGNPDDPREFVDRALRALEVEIDVPDGELGRIPATGPTVVVANHPLGGIDGLIAMSLLLRTRRDVRVLANSVLSRIHPLEPLLIPVDPFGGAGAEQRNLCGMRAAIRWVQNGGMLLVFPAGEVAHRTWTRRRVADPAWQPHIARMIARSGATVTPMFLGGQNGRMFQLAGLLHARLRTAMLPRELLRRGPRKIPVRIGNSISPANLARFEDSNELTDYLRLRTEILQRRSIEPRARRDDALVHVEPIAAPIPVEHLRAEIDALPSEACMLSSGPHRVFLAKADAIPLILREIGRLREIAFRAVGEGTGRTRDNDRYDSTYRHLFIWHDERQCLIGSYRMGLTDELTRGRSETGLYTESLFEFDPRFLELVNPAIELGRSFVRIEDQRSYAPLKLLWQGIGAFVTANPRYHTLFGAVSISASYDPASLQLILDYLRNYEFRPDLAGWIRPRNPVARRGAATRHLRWTSSMLEDINQVSSMVAEIERDEKGIPILVREYLKLGGKLAGFNVDPDFGDAVDGLVIVDLRETPMRLLGRYLGPDAALALLAHAKKASGDREFLLR